MLTVNPVRCGRVKRAPSRSTRTGCCPAGEVFRIYGFWARPALASINCCTGATTMSSRSALGIFA